MATVPDDYSYDDDFTPLDHKEAQQLNSIEIDEDDFLSSPENSINAMGFGDFNNLGCFDQFEPTPIPSNLVPSKSQLSPEYLSMFEPTPMRSEPHRSQAATSNLRSTTIESNSYPIAPNHQNPLLQSREFQAALMHLRNSVDQQQHQNVSNLSASQTQKSFNEVGATAAIQLVFNNKQEELNLLHSMKGNNASGSQFQNLYQLMLRNNQINEMTSMTENQCQHLQRMFAMKNKSDWQGGNQTINNGSMELNQNKVLNLDPNRSIHSGDSPMTFLGNKIQQGHNSSSEQLDALFAKKQAVVQSITSQPQSNLKPVNTSMHAYGTALEKLCETMKRSAMSRTMIKQLSAARTLPKQGSGRGNMKQHPGRDLSALALQASGRADELLPISAALSSSSVSSGRLTPPRVPNRRSATESKHRMTRESASIRSTSPSHRSRRENSGRSLSSDDVWNDLITRDSELGNTTNDVDNDFFGDLIFSD
jgi:hypothetical protein